MSSHIHEASLEAPEPHGRNKRRMRPFGILGCVMLAAGLCQGTQTQRDHLTLEQRVQAQEAIERVYYSHQIDASRSFDEAVPRALLDRKVRAYLKESAALETYWKTPVTAEMLGRELERIAADTRMPDRLRQLYAALGNDPLLIQESLARPALVDRMARNFFAYDAVIHAPRRREAEALHRDLSRGRLNARSEHSRRVLVELVRGGDAGEEDRPDERSQSADSGNPEPLRLELPTDEFDRYLDRLPARVGDIGPLREEREAFVVQVVLEKGGDALKVATFAVPKVTWDEWWNSVADHLDETSVQVVNRDDRLLPLPTTGPSNSFPETACPPANSWDNGSLSAPGYSPDARYGHTAVWTGSLMIVWGGYWTGTQAAGSVASGGRYDPTLDSWTATSTLNVPIPRLGHTAVWTGSRVIVWGGSAFSSYPDTGGRYDPITDTWASTTAINAPVGRVGHTAIWTGSQMVVWGGTDSSSAYLQDGGRYDPATDAWSSVSTTDAPSSRGGHSAIWTGSLMVVWGGSSASGEQATGARYDPSADVWTPTSLSGLSGRTAHSAVWTGSAMIVWGGSSGGMYNDGARYNPVTDQWSSMSTTNAPTARHAHSAVWTGSVMIVWGGQDGAYLRTGGRYDPAANAWMSIDAAGAPSVRSRHTAVWTGSLMVVWGGYDGAGALETGGRYDPASDNWTPTKVKAPGGRTSHTMLWTGNLMIVWGGYGWNGQNSISLLGSGGRYDPVIDVWTPTASPFPVVFGRYNHVAVWTGSFMVVWGGFNGTFVSTGGRYDPLADTWVPTSTSNAPSPRVYPSVVWTGSRMIVWGGGTPGLNTGGLYDPVADTWTPTSTGANVPAGRYRHTAVWTGSTMIVWGGSGSGFVDVNTGGRYNPGNDTWMPTSTVNAPSARSGHTAVWTGGRMLVWGGLLNTGGRYDPVSDTWTPMSTVNAPSARNLNTLVWSGNLAVAWGGTGASGHVNSGGRYDPVLDAWTPTCTNGAPSPRAYHTAVWAETQMIVWGGQSPNFVYLDNGGRYSLGPGVDADGDCFTECQGDCNDGAASVYPGASELCDGLDNDCNGSIDGFATTCGTGQCARNGFCASGVDSCVPGSPSVEVCDGIDNNCDGIVDNATDDDHDGLNECQGDCNDANPAIRLGFGELCDNLDNNCDGTIDNFVTLCGTGQCIRTGFCTSGTDTCVPGLPSTEVCDGIDNNCDGLTDNVPVPVGTPFVTIDLSTPTPTLVWASLPDATTYDVVSGNLGALLSTAGDFTAAIQTCLAEDTGANNLALADSPPLGSAFFYVARANNCGGQGTYDSGDPAQSGSRDGEIDLSSASCSPHCGDFVCDATEDCFTCPNDCECPCFPFCDGVPGTSRSVEP